MQGNPVETSLSAEELAAEGYRRVSGKYRLAARVDRPDWIIVLADKLLRTPADFFQPGHTEPADHWKDHYLRVYSTDVVQMPLETPWEEWKKIPGAL